MGPSRRARLRAAAMIGAALLVASALEAQAPPTGEPFAVEATALMPLDTESALSIVGIRGQITVSSRDERELRVISRAPGAQGAELPVGIWQDGSKLILAPAPGAERGACQLHVEIPKGFSVVVAADDSDVVVQTDGGDVELRGTNVRATIRTGGGSLSAALAGGTLSVRDSKGATVRIRDTAATFGALSGNVRVNAAGGTVSLAAIEGSADIESDGSQLVFDGLSGFVHLKAQKGDAKVSGLNAGAEIALGGTPLHLKGGKGDITVTTDAPVDFQEMAASMHFDMDGGSLRGKGNDGIIELRARNTEVNVEAIAGGMRIQGDGLTAKIVDVGGELHVETAISDVVVDRAAVVVLKVDRGNVTIQRATAAVQATVVGGEVHIIDGSGPVTLDADRGDAEVTWASLSGDKESRLVNKGGSLTVRFPTSGGGRVEAKSEDGRIDSDLPTVRVMDDLKEAQGPVNGGNRPIIRIVASGDIHLLGAEKAPEE